MVSKLKLSEGKVAQPEVIKQISWASNGDLIAGGHHLNYRHHLPVIHRT
jgi:hypothetical protein